MPVTRTISLAEAGDVFGGDFFGAAFEKLEQAIHGGEGVGDFVGDAGGHLSHGDHCTLLDHELLLAAEANGHFANSAILMDEAAAARAEVVGDAAGEIDGGEEGEVPADVGGDLHTGGRVSDGREEGAFDHADRRRRRRRRPARG